MPPFALFLSAAASSCLVLQSHSFSARVAQCSFTAPCANCPAQHVYGLQLALALSDCVREDISSDATTTLRRLFFGHQLRNALQLSEFPKVIAQISQTYFTELETAA